MDHHFLAGKYQNVEVFSGDQYECMAKVDFSVLSYLVKECGVGDAQRTDFLYSLFDRCDLGFFSECVQLVSSPWGRRRTVGDRSRLGSLLVKFFLLLACTLVGSAL